MALTPKEKAKETMFSKAEKISLTPAPVPGREFDTVYIAGVQELAALRELIRALEEAERQQNAALTSRMIDEFIARGRALGSRPRNYTAMDGHAEASFQLNSRGEKKSLTEDELKLLRHHKIPVRKVAVRQPLYVINADYAKNQDLLQQAHAALDAIPGFPKDFIKRLTETRSYVEDQTIDAVFALDDPQLVRTLLPVVTTPAIRTSFAVGFGAAWDIVKNMIPKRTDPAAPREPWGASLTAKVARHLPGPAKRPLERLK